MSHPVRKSPRLRDFDYTVPGPYFITTNLNRRTPLFGTVMIIDANLKLSSAGNMIHETWVSVPEEFPGVVLDDFIVMPDHVHAILTLPGSFDTRSGVSLSDVVGWFKSKTNTVYNQGVRDLGWPAYEQRFWQGRFHDHIIRDDKDLEARRKYIERNPWRWIEARS